MFTGFFRIALGCADILYLKPGDTAVLCPAGCAGHGAGMENPIAGGGFQRIFARNWEGTEQLREK